MASQASSPTTTKRSSSKKERIVTLANELLRICSPPKYPAPVEFQIPTRITSTRHLNSSALYIYFYENICDVELIDKKWPPKSIEHEIENVQAVIDSLSLDVLHEDLTYLTGEAICKPDLTSIEYLLEILKSVHEWITSQVVEATTTTSSVTIACSTARRLEAPQSCGQSKKNVVNDEKEELVKLGKIDLVRPETITSETYENLNEKIEETIRMTRKALGNVEPTLAAVEDDVFKNYMRQYEEEYRKKARKECCEKSSSGNSSLEVSNDDLIRYICSL